MFIMLMMWCLFDLYLVYVYQPTGNKSVKGNRNFVYRRKITCENHIAQKKTACLTTSDGADLICDEL